MIDFVRCNLSEKWPIAAGVDELRHGRPLLVMLSVALAKGTWRTSAIVPAETVLAALKLPIRTSLVRGEEDIGAPVSAIAADQQWSAEQSLDAFSYFLSDRVKGAPPSLLVIEDQASAKRSPVESKMASQKCYIGQTVYRMMSTDDPESRALFYQLCRESGNIYLWAAVLSALHRTEFESDGGELTTDDLERIAQSATLIGFVAFDGDGVLVFERD